MRSLGMASRNCCKVQAAVGWAVTLQCRMRRFQTSITTNKYSTRKPAVMATKKSAATMALAWLRTNVRQCCEAVLLPPRGSLSCGQYARTVRGETRIPSFTESSAAMRSSPPVGFSCTMRPLAPGRVLLPHAHNQLAKIFRNPRSSQPRLPPPKQLEPLAMPADEGLRLNNHQCRSPVEQLRPYNQGEARCVAEPAGPNLVFLVERQLFAQEQYFGTQFRA